MNKDKLLNVIAEALDVDAVTLVSDQSNTQEWDSLGHLSILAALDDKLKGQVSKLSNLGKLTSVKEIYNELAKANLVVD